MWRSSASTPAPPATTFGYFNQNDSVPVVDSNLAIWQFRFIQTEEIQQEVKRVNQLDHSTPIRTMQSKPLSRTVSFRHQPTTQRKCSPVPNNNWIYSNLATDYNRSPIIPIPRPVLRYSNINENWASSMFSFHINKFRDSDHADRFFFCYWILLYWLYFS